MVKQQRGRDLLDLCAILAGWAAAIATVAPRGNFPLNDDWDFALATWSFARTGSFHFSAYTVASLRAQVLWGAAWTKLFGESFEVLRAATLTHSGLLITLVFFAFRSAGLSRGLRFAATLAFAFNPIFFWSSCTYMTEVPYVFASSVALILFYLALRDDRLDLLVAACAAVVVSWFVRQTGVINLLAPLALMVGWRSRLTPRWKTFAAITGATLLLFVVLWVVEPSWLTGSAAEFANHVRMWTEVTFRLPQQVSVVDHYSVFNAQNAALFFLPMTVPLVAVSVPRKRWEWILLAVVSLIVLPRIVDLVASSHLMPYFAMPARSDITAGNILVNWGLGPQTLSDIWGKSQTYPLQLTRGARLFLTLGSALAAIVLLWRSAMALVRDRRLLVQLAIGTAIAGTLALFGSGFYYDRYSFDSMWSVGLLAPLLLEWSRRSVRVIAVVCLVGVIAFDIAAVREYFAWNRARWAAFDSLRARGVPVEQIDGGSEPFAFHEMANMTQQQRRKFFIASKTRPYLLAFRPIHGYAVVDRHPFSGWLIGDGAIYTLRAR